MSVYFLCVFVRWCLRACWCVCPCHRCCVYALAGRVPSPFPYDHPHTKGRPGFFWRPPLPIISPPIM